MQIIAIQLETFVKNITLLTWLCNCKIFHWFGSAIDFHLLFFFSILQWNYFTEQATRYIR